MRNPRQEDERRNKHRNLHETVKAVEPLLKLAREPLFMDWADRYERTAVDAMVNLPAAAHEERYAAAIAIRTVREIRGYLQMEAIRSYQAEKQIEAMNRIGHVGGGTVM